MQAALSAAAAAAAVALDEQPGAPLEASQPPQQTTEPTTIEQIEGQVQQMHDRSSIHHSDADGDDDDGPRSCDEGDPALAASLIDHRAAARARDPDWAELQSLVHKVSLLQRQSDHLAQLSSLQKQMIEKHAYRPSEAASGSSVVVSSSRSSAAADLSRNPFTPIQLLSPINPYLHPQYAPLDEFKSSPIPLRMQDPAADAASTTAAAAAAPPAFSPPRSWTDSPHSYSRSASSSAGTSVAASPVPVPSGSPAPSCIRSQWEMRRSRGTHDHSQDGSPRPSPQLLNLADVRHPASFLADGDEHKDDGGAFDDESRSSTQRSPRRTGHHTVSVSGDEDDRASVTFSQYAYSGRGPPSVIGSVSSSLYAHHAPSLITSTIRSGSPSTVSVGARSIGARSVNGGLSVDGDDSHAHSEQLDEFDEESTRIAEIDEDDAQHSSSDATDEHAEQHSQTSSSAAVPRADSLAAASAASHSAASPLFVASSPPLTASSLAHLNRPSSRSLKARLRMRAQLQRSHQHATPLDHAEEERNDAAHGGNSTVIAPPLVSTAPSADPCIGVPAASTAPSVASAPQAAPPPIALSASSATSASSVAASTPPRLHHLGSMGQSLFVTLMRQMHDTRRQTR